MTIPADDEQRAEMFYYAAQRIILNWMRDCRIKVPMSDEPDVLMHLCGAITEELEKTYQGTKHPDTST